LSVRKNPAVTAILNFLIPGLGFVYIGTTLFVIGGLVEIFFSIIETGLLLVYPVPPALWLLSVGAAFAWAILGYGAAESFNGKLPMNLPRSPQLQVPQSTPSMQNAEVKFCRYCGEGNKTDAAFCERCGKKIG